MVSSTKKCRGECGEVKSLSDFYANDNTCKDCRKAKVRAYREANIEQVKAYDRERGRTEERKAKNAERRPLYKGKQTEWNREWRKRNPEKYAAHIALNNAIRDNKLTKGACEVCGVTEVEAHHDDYSKPLDVRWLCVKHHGETRRIDPAEAAE